MQEGDKISVTDVVTSHVLSDETYASLLPYRDVIINSGRFVEPNLRRKLASLYNSIFGASVCTSCGSSSEFVQWLRINIERKEAVQQASALSVTANKPLKIPANEASHQKRGLRPVIK